MTPFRNSLLLFVLGFVNICEYVRTSDNEGSPTSPKKPSVFYRPSFWSEEVNIAEGNRLLAQEKYRQAVKCFDRAIAQNKEKSLYYVMRGKCYLYWGSYPSASDDFYKALQTAISHGEDTSSILEEADLALLVRMLVKHHKCYASRNMDKGYESRTIFCLNELVQRDPQNAEYILLRGRCRWSFSKSKDAVDDLKQAVQLDAENKYNSQVYLRETITWNKPFDKETALLLNCAELTSMGNTFRAKKDFEIALYCYDEAIERKSEETEKLLRAHLERAKCYLAMEQWNMAIADHKKRVELKPHDIKDCWFQFTSLLFEHKRFKEFSDEADILLSNEELVELAKLFFSENNSEYAARIFSEAIRRDPSQGSYYKHRADCYVELNELDLATADLKVWIQQNPDKEEDRIKLKTLKMDIKTRQLVDLGLRYLKDNRFGLAINYFMGALEDSPDCELCTEKEGICHWKMNNFKAAIIDLEKTIELAPWDLIPQVDLCEVFVDNENYDQAEKCLDEVEKKLENINCSKTKERLQDIRQKMKISKSRI